MNIGKWAVVTEAKWACPTCGLTYATKGGANRCARRHRR
jgi:hypothetical protein